MHNSVIMFQFKKYYKVINNNTITDYIDTQCKCLRTNH